MPIARTVNGLILVEPFSALGSWSFQHSGSYYYGYGIQNNGITQDPTSINTEAVQNSDAWYQQTLNLGSGSGRQVHLYASSYGTTGSWARGFESPNTTIFNQNGPTVPGFQHVTGALSDLDTGNQTIKVAHTHADNNSQYSMSVWVTHLVVCTGNTLTVQGLAAGQKVELYQQSGSLLATATVALASTSISIDLTNIYFPDQMYFKIYKPGGTTVIETTPVAQVSGGDTWVWYVPAGPLTASASQFVIYPTGSPTQSTITATLVQSNGSPYAGATVTFVTTLGTLTASSGVTDSNGHVSTVLSSSTFGLAVVECSWAGDANVSAGMAFVNVHIFYGPETADSTKPFQIFVEGYSLIPASGTYTTNYRMLSGQFQVAIPAWDDNIVVNGLVGIWRYGVKEYGGILQRVERTLGDHPTVTLYGIDFAGLMAQRVVDLEYLFSMTAQAAISYLLNKYYCGLTVGSLPGTSPTVNVTVDTETLQAAVKSICDAVGYVYRVNPNLTLDFASAFGRGLQSVAFTEGVNLSSCQTITDYSTEVNVLHTKGNGIRTIASDLTSLEEIGLMEGTDLQSTITDQPTLNTQAQADLNNLQNAAVVTITLEGVDETVPGTFLPEDQVTVTSPTLDLSGGYQIAQITRDFAKLATYVNMQLNGLLREFLLLDEKYRRIVHDLGVS
jgi:Bacterial Ig-like domain (group 1)